MASPYDYGLMSGIVIASEAKQSNWPASGKGWIASSASLLAMTPTE
jgi:hypothetical protein